MLKTPYSVVSDAPCMLIGIHAAFSGPRAYTQRSERRSPCRQTRSVHSPAYTECSKRRFPWRETRSVHARPCTQRSKRRLDASAHVAPFVAHATCGDARIHSGSLAIESRREILDCANNRSASSTRLSCMHRSQHNTAIYSDTLHDIIQYTYCSPWPWGTPVGLQGERWERIEREEVKDGQVRH